MSTVEAPTTFYTVSVERDGETTDTEVKDRGWQYDRTHGNYRENAERAFFKEVHKAEKDDKITCIRLFAQQRGGTINEIDASTRVVLSYTRDRLA